MTAGPDLWFGHAPMPPAPTPYEPPMLDFEDFGKALRSKSRSELRAARFVLATIQRPWLLRSGTILARAGLALRVPGTEAALAATVFRQFCGGTNLEQALACARRLNERGIGSILDYAVEGEDDEADFDRVTGEIDRVVLAAANRDEVAFAAIKLTGVARFELLERMDAGADISAEERAEFDRARDRLHRIATRARDSGTSFFIDAEHSWLQDAIDIEAERLMAEFNGERAVANTTIQLYLRTGLPYLKKAVARARAEGYVFGCKLVRGAYMEQENARAADRGYESPIQPSKPATDADDDAAITFCLENIDAVRVCVATHNVTSVRHMVSEMARLGIAADDPRVCSSQLLGMFDRVTAPLADHGYKVHKYVPYGNVRDAFPYLLRRADENRSVAEQLASELDAVRAELDRRRRA